ncbi:MAG: DUF308 domain-containing protein, partial [Bacilli bacterium]|nr:DUF308 domain-containing protein [Bacilli bacterium]
MLTPEEISQAEMQKRYDDVTYIQRVRKNVPTEPTTAPFRPLFVVAMIASIALIVIGIVALTRFFSGSMAGLFIAIPLIAGGVLSLVMIIATMRRYKKKKASKLVMLVAGTPEAIGPKETVVYKPNQKLVGDETATKIKKEQKVRVLNDDSAARGFKRDTRKAERIIAQGVSLEGARDALRANIAAEGISILESDFSRLYAHLAYSRFLVLEDVKPELRLKLVRAIANTFSAIGTVDHPIGDFMDYQHLAPRNVESNRVMGFEFDSYEDIAAYFVHAIDEISDYGIDHTFKSKMMLGKNHVIIAFFDGSLANLDPKLLACCSALPLTLEEAEVPEDSRT